MNLHSDDVSGWLGRDEIYNSARGVTEHLEDYLLRHTRQIPRDVVQIGNQLSNAVVKAKGRGDKMLSDVDIRRAVGLVAKICADEQMAVCANHLASDMMPAAAGRSRISDYYTDELYSRGVQGEICDLVKAVGNDRFRMSRLEEALGRFNEGVLVSHRDPLQVLWLNGLLGYDPPDQTQRRSHSTAGSMSRTMNSRRVLIGTCSTRSSDTRFGSKLQVKSP